jgi:hypothetical protein
VNVFGDYGLNLYNSVDFLLAKELGISEALISHETKPEDALRMNFHGVMPELAIGGRISVMTSEHCPVKDVASCKCDEEQEYYLKDRKGYLYPILTNPADCRSIILSHKETKPELSKEERKRAGIHHLRIYV